MFSKTAVKRNLVISLLGLLITFQFTGCINGDKKQKVTKPPSPSLNIMMLLDLSDRLIIVEDQASRDVELINHVCSQLVRYIRDSSNVTGSKETIKIQVAHQDNIPYTTSKYKDSLYFKMGKDVIGGMPAIKKILEGRFPRNVALLYDSAVYSSNPKDYSGANLSRYFINDLKYDIKNDPLTRNLLFIFTDGYVVVGNETNAMLDVHNTFPDLEVMVLEIAPRNIEYEAERLEQSWDRWFAKMGIKAYTLRYNNFPVKDVKDNITSFLLGTLELQEPGASRDTIAHHPPLPPPDTTATVNGSKIEEKVVINRKKYIPGSNLSDLLPRLVNADDLVLRDQIRQNIFDLCRDNLITVDMFSGTSTLGQPNSLDNYLKEIRHIKPQRIEILETKKNDEGKYIYLKVRHHY